MAGDPDFHALIFEGRDASAEAIEALEARLAVEPADLETRARLIGAYLFRRRPDARARDLARWIIENEPASAAAAAIARTPIFGRLPGLAAHEDVELVWERTLAGLDAPDEQLGQAFLNAAYCAQFSDDSERHVRWRERARSLLTGEDARLSLAHLEVLHLRANDSRPAAERLPRLEEIAADPRFTNLSREALAVVSFEANDDARAERYATELLEHKRADLRALGHWLLGHLALRRGDVEGAIAHNMHTVSIEVTPKMRLAKELLQHGHRDAVLRYLEALAALPQPRPWLPGWIDDVRARRMPDFRGTLHY
jgi:hypothetical protein